MKPGDMILIPARAHSYPVGWRYWKKTDGSPHVYSVDTPVLLLSQFLENSVSNPRTFYRILTPNGIHDIVSTLCREIP